MKYKSVKKDSMKELAIASVARKSKKMKKHSDEKQDMAMMKKKVKKSCMK